MIAGIMFTANDIMAMLYSDTYNISGQVLNILSVMIVISPIGYLLGSRVMLVTNNEAKMLLVVAIGAIVNVIGNYILIINYQEFGAAVASLISELAVMIIYVNFGRKHFKLISYKKETLKIILSTIVMCLCLALIQNIVTNRLINILIQIIAGCIIYLLTLFLLKSSIIF